MLERARVRGEETGRIVPEEDIRDSLYRVPRTVTSLLPKADFVAHIEVLIGVLGWGMREGSPGDGIAWRDAMRTRATRRGVLSVLQPLEDNRIFF